jgi:hypothetical protein
MALDDSTLLDITGLATCQQINMTSFPNVVSNWAPIFPHYLLTPITSPNGKVMILNQGHSDRTSCWSEIRYPQIVHDLLTQHYTVAMTLMPIVPHGPPLQDFYGPQVSIMNLLVSLGYSGKIFMHGVSGGGHTSSLQRLPVDLNQDGFRRAG